MVLKSILILLISFSTLSIEHNPAQIGEKSFSHYFGPRDPFMEFDAFDGSVKFVDQQIERDYLFGLISNELKNLDFYLSSEFWQGMTCPHSYNDKYFHYFQYLYRLTSLSYLYEAIIQYHFTTKKMGIQNTCKVVWEKELKKCQPKSKEMKFFVANSLKSKIKPEFFYIQADHSERSFITDWEQRRKLKKYDSISEIRYKHFCHQNKCTNPDKKSLQINFTKICEEDLKLFNTICSEKDHLYGMNKIQEPYDIILQSNVLEPYDENGVALGCLRRFRAQTKHKEKRTKYLEDLYPYVYNFLSEHSKKKIYGELFPFGTLSDYIDQGLVKLFNKKDRKKIKLVKTIEEPVTYIEDSQIKKLVNINPTAKLTQKKRKKKKKKDIKSAFLLASELRRQYNMEKVRVDMLKFKYDFIFTLSLKKTLDMNLGMFLKPEILKKMKNLNHLGQAKSPLPLMMLKYILETQENSKVKTFIEILGNKFYVINDLDKNQRTVDFVRINLVRKKWQIYILKPSTNQLE